MHLSRLDIRRLGQLRDVTIDPLSPQLTIVYGPNEAGKSTVRDAIRYALFGFPAKNPAKSAVDSRTYSGADRQVAARFVSPDGDLHLERTVDGKKLSQGDLVISPEAATSNFRSMTEGIDSTMYHTMWNVSLANLPNIDPSRDSEPVLAKLHAAEHGTEVSPSAALTALTKEMDALFSSTKRDVATIKSSIGRVTELRDQLSEAQSRAGLIAGVRAELASVSEAAEEAAGTRQTLQSRRSALADDATTIRRLVDDAPAIAERVREAEEEQQIASERACAGQSDDIRRLLGLATKVHSLELDRALVEEKRSESERLIGAIDELTVKLARYRDVPQVLDGADSERLVSQLEQLQRQIARTGDDLAVALSDLEVERQRLSTQAEPREGSSRRSLVPVAIALVVGLAITAASWLGGAGTATTIFDIIATATLAGALWWWGGRGAGAAPLGADDGALLSATSNHRARLAASAEAQRAWDSFVDGEPLLKPLAGNSPEDVIVAVRQSATRAQLESELAVMEKQLDRARSAQTAWQSAVDSVLADAQVTGEVRHTSLEALAAAVRAAELTVSNAGQAGESLPRLTRALHAAQEAKSQHDTAVDAILSRYGASSAVEAIAAISAQLEELDVTLAQTDRDHNELRSRLGELRATIQAAEASHDVERLAADLEMAKSKLTAQTRAYTVSLLARTIIERGIEHFEGEGRPGVMDSAGTIFAQLTGDAYEGVEASEGVGDMEVVAADGSRKSVAHLSVGTIEQLYLALRFGALLALPNRGRELPVLLDEVLANYDETRSSYGFGAIAELAKSRQVIYFTCREEVAEGLRRAAAERNVDTVQVSMEAGKVVGQGSIRGRRRGAELSPANHPPVTKV